MDNERQPQTGIDLEQTLKNMDIAAKEDRERFFAVSDKLIFQPKWNGKKAEIEETVQAWRDMTALPGYPDIDFPLELPEWFPEVKFASRWKKGELTTAPPERNEKRSANADRQNIAPAGIDPGDLKVYYEQAIVSGGVEAYDYIIDSQVKFNALIASPNWLGAKSVLFAADVETTREIVVPYSVETINGNNYIIFFNLNNLLTKQSFVCMAGNIRTELNEVNMNIISNYNKQNKVTAYSGFGSMNKCYCDISASEAIGYDNCRNLTDCTLNACASNLRGFLSCRNLENCYIDCLAQGASVAGSGYEYCININYCHVDLHSSEGYGYNYCENINNSTAYIEIVYWGAGMSDCSKIFGCDVILKYVNSDYLNHGIFSYRSCNQITYSTARSSMITPANNKPVTGYSYGFINCNFLTNCTSVGEYKNIGSSSEVYLEGYDYRNCSYCNGCGSGTLTSGYSRTGIWGGANTFVDAQSCRM